MILINYKKTNIFLSIILIIISIISGAIVSPINKGIDVFYTKPVSKEIDDLVSKNKSSIFLASDSGITLSNYIVVNGAKTINTTNYIPNLELYKKLDVDNKYNDIYNRYEHVAVNIVDKKTEFILNQDDYITINLNYSDVCKINVYKKGTRNKKIDGQWQQVDVFEFEDDIPFGHGEKSVYMIQPFMRITREEAFAIRYHMGFSGSDPVNNVGKAFEMFPLAFALSTADMEATYFLDVQV